jgi:serine/threonine protein phosphatase 1
VRWIIGDIHGMLASLETLVRAIDRVDPDRQLMFVGDYVNRGPNSKGVIDFLLSLPEVHTIRGNHDDLFDLVLSGQSYASKTGEAERMNSFIWFLQHGLDKTLESYGINKSEVARVLANPTTAALDYLLEPIPQAHRSFIRNLAVVLETNDMFVVHAKWDIYSPTLKPTIAERLAADETTRYGLIWGRYQPHEIDAEKAWERTGYFGHTPVHNYVSDGDLLPVVGPKIVLLDTAAALLPKGRLTAVCHENGTYLQSDPSGKMVASS